MENNKTNNLYKYILSIVNNEHFYYVFFFGILGILILIEVVNIGFDENVLIGGLFIIGSFTVLQYIRYLYINNSIKHIKQLKQKYELRKNLIYKYKFYFLKLIFFYLIYFYKIRYFLINYKFEKLIIKLLSKFNVIEYILIYIQLLYKNILNFYYNIEQIIIFNFWFNSIKAAYNKLI
jgi:hypothetical protein